MDVYVITCMPDAQGRQKRALDSLQMEFRMVVSYDVDRCWELNWALLQKQQVLLTADLSLQSHSMDF